MCYYTAVVDVAATANDECIAHDQSTMLDDSEGVSSVGSPCYSVLLLAQQ
jgi:hypothetical protein